MDSPNYHERLLQASPGFMMMDGDIPSKTVNVAFTPVQVKRMSEAIIKIVHGLLEGLVEKNGNPCR